MEPEIRGLWTLLGLRGYPPSSVQNPLNREV